MKKITFFAGLLFFLSVCAITESDVGPDIPGRVLRVRDGRIISFMQMIKEVKKADLVFVGEVHDDSGHHRAELNVMIAFHESATPVAVGLEMFRSDSQNVLNAWVKGKLATKDFLPAYFDNWQMPWSFYRKIFLYAREHEIPLLGLNIPDAISQKVAEGGFASLTKAERKQLPPGISCSVDETYMAIIKKVYADHRSQGREFVNFCEAQMVWDKTMAWHLVNYVKENPGKAVVVLAGVGHAWKRGIPEHVETGSKLTSRVILPLVPDQIDQKTVTLKDADYVLLDY
jgi:uncharacterized iron-regulated protein